jgi:N-acetylglutamate synthase
MGHAVGGHQQPSIPAMEREDAPTGRHALGPHVVGMRVVVRRVLPGKTGPSGGPAMTDVLGVCEAWGDGVATLRRDDGTVVEIATRDIVSGKPVPQRPSARMRVTPREAEGHAAPLWPQVERVALGEWELRTDPAPVDRLRKRANSCLAMGEPDRLFDAAAEAIRSFYATRGREALVQVLVASAEEEAFRAAG